MGDDPRVATVSEVTSTRRVNIVVYACLVLVLAVAVYQLVERNTEASMMQQEIGQEFSSIRPVPGSKLADSQAYHSVDKAYVGADYTVSAGGELISAYYRSELVASGWSYVSRQMILDTGRSYGGWSDVYCKAGQQAELDYSGNVAAYGWTYSFSIQWGAASRCR